MIIINTNKSQKVLLKITTSDKSVSKTLKESSYNADNYYPSKNYVEEYYEDSEDRDLISYCIKST